LVVDWGGVLTPPFGVAVAEWATAERIDLDHYLAVLARHLGAAAVVPAAENPFQAVECGRMPPAEFERWLAGTLRRQDGRPVDPAGLLARMFAGFGTVPEMAALVRRIRGAGVPVALLSNSWGQPYSEQQWAELFDATVVSCTAGVRKPDPEAYLLAARMLGRRPDQCVFVDDLRSNVAGATAVGMTGVWHRDVAETTGVLLRCFGLPDGSRPQPA
jgi:epoxide hydrolase-like predicted phosphatase